MPKLAVALAAVLASQAAQAEPYRPLPRIAPAKVLHRARVDAAQAQAAAPAHAPVFVLADAEGPINVIAVGETPASTSTSTPTPTPTAASTPTSTSTSTATAASTPTPTPTSVAGAQPEEDSAAPEDTALAGLDVDPAILDEPEATPPAVRGPATTVVAVSLGDLTTLVDARTPSGERVEVLADGAGGHLEIIRDRDGNVVAARNRSGRADL